MVYVACPLPDPWSGVMVTHASGVEVVQEQLLAVVIATVPVAPLPGPLRSVAGLSEIAQDPVEFGSRLKVSLSTSPKLSDAPARMRPVRLSVLWPMVTASGARAMRWSGGRGEARGTSPALVCRTTPPLGAGPGSH